MKKRLVAVLLAINIMSASPIAVFAEAQDNQEELQTENSEEKQETSEDGESENTEETGSLYTTGAQEDAESEVEDVDQDIREEIQALIPETIEEITIGSADEFLDFASKCTLDTWSVNKKVTLTEDISLGGKDFGGIPSFGGVFDGQGHSLTGVSIKSGLSYVGLFVHVQKTGVIKNLNLTGSVIPEGNTTIIGGIAGDNNGNISNCSFNGVVKGNDYIGGVAGINELTGKIDHCTSDGYISGVHFTGGIAGLNEGDIENCTNKAFVNTTNTDTEITIDSFEKLTSVINLIKDGLGKERDVAKESITVYDTGGIAGQSIGIISRCINDGEIGYDHVGYNVGGIAGRQSGYLYKCSNNGLIKGRKDIGGIVGQAEPYVTVDLSSDIAVQLQKSVSKLHDSVTTTLQDAKSQSNTISERLAVIQKFTGGAVEDTRYIAAGVVDFANGVSASASEAFSRVDYVLEETSKQDGAFDKVSEGMEEIGESSLDISDVGEDVDIEMYIENEDELRQYTEAKTILESATAQYTELRRRSQRVFYNLAIANNKALFDTAADVQYRYANDSVETDFGSWSESDIGTGLNSDMDGFWEHSDGRAFPQDKNEEDSNLHKMAQVKADADGIRYATDNYVNPITGEKGNYADDIATATATILGIYEKHLPEMTDDVRSDAQSAMNNLDEAADAFASATDQTKDILAEVAGRGSIGFPQFSPEYKARTASLADNMQGMNDNFGLLNSEVNNATGVLVDDLQNINDQFANILSLYTDAIDGVLEKDYTDKYTDTSYEAVNDTTDATIDSCLNYGECKSDISASGIAGTMAIDFDFDQEGVLTGLKNNSILTSYITRCVLRNNKNYGDITTLKDNAGGVCGLQEMGTIYNCGSFAKVASTSGEYVGGVTGSSLSHIVKSYAKGELDGKNYVGGIAGNAMHLKECLSIVTVGNAENWYGAIAGHVDEKGEVRDNFFVSDDLAGIDRVSYSLKAEPVNYKVAMGVKDIPYEFNALNINFMVEDEDLEGGKMKVGQISKKYGESIALPEYPKVDEKEGYYVTWDIDGVERIVNDITITAKYNRYRTTIAQESETKGFYQSELLVDGMFKDNEKLSVEKTITFEETADLPEEEHYYETLKVKIPYDGADVHQIRFKPLNEYAEVAELIPVDALKEFNLYLLDGDKSTLLEKKGMMGGYSLYEVEGNEFVLAMGAAHIDKLSLWAGRIICGVLIALAVLLILIIIAIWKNKGKLPKFFGGVKTTVSKKIESKEQIFYDDSQDDELKKELEEYKEKFLKKIDNKEGKTEEKTEQKTEDKAVVEGTPSESNDEVKEDSEESNNKESEE
jgi:hypothetical protein